MNRRLFHIHGDNIVECARAFGYIVEGLGTLVKEVAGPDVSVTCPVHTVRLDGCDLVFRFLPGYGERRWNQDVLAFVQRSGGRLREAADAIVTRVEDGGETPLAAIEFCGALPAGNQAWQRQGRAFSFAHAGIPYFYVAELGGLELDAERRSRGERLPNPAIPFSFLAMTRHGRAPCLPVYEANAGASAGTVAYYRPAFGKAEFLDFLKRAVLGRPTKPAADRLGERCVALVDLLAAAKEGRGTLRSDQWVAARNAVLAGASLPEFLHENARLRWKKTAYIKGLTPSARLFMELGARESFGLTSNALPLSFVPGWNRPAFGRKAMALYPDMDDRFAAWLARDDRPLAISWVLGFKPGGDDARPDRGLPPLARMLVGDDCDVMSFVYGPAPATHWRDLAADPAALARHNGLWEAVLAVSDAVLLDSATRPPQTPRGYLKDRWAAVLDEERIPLRVVPQVRRLGEQDVDTALHVAFESLGSDIVFEGMCNPPGGDWSGISFRWDSAGPEHRWLTLPRVSADGAKRPDHVFALFGHGNGAICLCIESKERARLLEADIGPRLTRYAEALFAHAPSIHRNGRVDPWAIYDVEWQRRDVTYVSAGAYLAAAAAPFRGAPEQSGLDIQIGVEFSGGGETCTLHLRGDTGKGRAVVGYLAGLPGWGRFVTLKVSNSDRGFP